MKIQKSPWDFSPRRWSRPEHHHPCTDQQKFDQLRSEHPLLSRGVEVAQMGAWVALGQSQGAPWVQASAGLAGVTAVASAAWGMNKLIRGETGLDRIEGLGHLALASAYATGGLELLRPQLSWTSSVGNVSDGAAASCEMLLGAADLVRGLKENDSPRTWTGAAGILSGASLAASVLWPGASGLAQAVAISSMAVRQSILGGR